MSTCPSTQQLIRLIDEELTEPEITEISDHVQRCQGCQTRLDEITRGRLADIVGLFATVETPSAEGDAACVPEMMTESTEETTDFSSALRDQDQATEQQPDPGPVAEIKRDEVTVDRQPAIADQTGVYQPIHSTRSQSGSPATAMPSGGMPKIPGYELVEKLGQGGMGVVYKARQVGLNRLVAVKMIRGGEQARPEHFARFRVEAEAVAQLDHPNIIQIYEIGAVDDLPFVSLELL